jgi:hypothetical protein
MDIRLINVVGAGSLGSFTVQILTKMQPSLSCPIAVWDFDRVEQHNVNNQIYSAGYKGRLKVRALSSIIYELGGPNIITLPFAVDKDSDLRGVVVVAVDSMAARKIIFDLCRFDYSVDYLIEARMGGHLGRIFALDPKNPIAITRYEQSLHGDDNIANPVCTTNETLPALWMVSASIARLVLSYQHTDVLRHTYIEGVINLTDEPVANFSPYVLI